MKWKFKSSWARFVFISRIIFISAILSACCIPILFMIHGAMWLISGLAIIFMVLVCVSWITPGILIILGNPNLAYAWNHGINPIGFSDTPWKLLSSKQRRSVYIRSMITFFAVVAYIFWFISEQ